MPLHLACPLLISHGSLAGRPTAAYAIEELARLLGRLGATVSCREYAGDGRVILIAAAGDGPDGLDGLDAIRHDGYRIRIAASGIALGGPQDKSLLNAVYDLVERAGVRFLLPGVAGELIPSGPAALPCGEWTREPRLPFRGVFYQRIIEDFPVEDWLRFYAKLRCNAVAHEAADLPLARILGLRLEVGGHGLAGLLPRDRFAGEPELYRLFQPEDFNGQRMADSNFCVTNARTQAAVKSAFRKQLAGLDGIHAVHAWPDDLPAGGWCLCSSCRSLTPSDQALLAMRLLGEAAAEAGSPVRIPMPAYHDTMFPGGVVTPAPSTDLLFAPRERCYGHAIDDPTCARNRDYLRALTAWTAAFGGHGDPHVFEYYFDQILFRGLWPFLPGIIFQDQEAYRQAGIATFFSLQVAGPALAPEHNMLAFAWGGWEPEPQAEGFIRWLAEGIDPAAPQAWIDFLSARAAIFADALRTCDHQLGIYLDYRWLPENDQPFAAEMARSYADNARRLAEAGAALATRVGGHARAELSTLARQESARARLESADLAAMAHQQEASFHLAAHFNRRRPDALALAVAAFERGIAALDQAERIALDIGMPDKSWYVGNIARLLRREFTAKIARCRGGEAV